jgi:predicted nucleic acid-binding protein
MTRYILDTNVVVRFLRNDHPAMSSAAAELFRRSASGKTELYLDTTIVAEAAFVLTSFYKQGKSEVSDALRDLISGCRLKVSQPEVTLDALTRFKAQPVDFPDALVAAIAADQRAPIASFDRDFGRFRDVRRIEPVGSAPGSST